jgi:homoserine dehydrogenase
VLGDIVAAARNRLSGSRAPSESIYAHLPIRPIGESVTRYHISLDVEDRSGVLATVAGVFAKHEVSIATVRQSGRENDATLVIVTHGAPDAHLAATVAELGTLDIVRSIASVLRVEGGV